MRRVAILGGGMAGLTAAWQLSAPDCRDDFEVTVYQRGWRLGGKGASSRGTHGRIEEHGLHVWLGYYDNAFRLVREVYEALDRPATDPQCPIRTWREAFAPADRVGVADRVGPVWSHWMATFTRNDDEPGRADPRQQPLSAATFVRRGLDLLLDFADSSAARRSPAPAPRAVVLSGSPQPPPAPPVHLDVLLRQAELLTMVGAVQSLRLLSAGVPADGLVLDFLDRIQQDIALRVGADDDARRAGYLADLVVACLRGIIRDGLLAGPAGFASIDDLDFRAWLARHGASAESLDSPLVRGMYDLVFAYEQGDPARPRFSAGLGLFLAGKMFFEYKGAIFWSMQAGMGDVVFAPMYQALRARGVRFAFFHRVDQLHLSPDGGSVEAVTLGRQANVADGHYEPLIRVNGLPCFPSLPLEEQLTAPVPADLESHWTDRAAETPLRLRAGRDFDDVVLATSLGMVPHVCGELIRHSSRWRRMVDGVATVATQSLQLWLRSSEDALGWPHRGATVSAYVNPFDTYASMSHLVDREDWPRHDRPAAIGYFCSVLPDRWVADPAAAHRAVRRNAVGYLTRDVRHFWPASVCDRDGFRWDLLHGGAAPATEARLDTQYWRANVDPSDRYVQSLPGTGAHRLRADQTGYANLFLAGDWINSGLNAGCIEAAAMAGVQAANAVRRRPLTEGIIGTWYGLDTAGSAGRKGGRS